MQRGSPWSSLGGDHEGGDWISDLTEGDKIYSLYLWTGWRMDFGGASLIAQLVKNPPATQETPVQFLGWEDPLKKG